jgi:hypothetical protein
MTEEQMTLAARKAGELLRRELAKERARRQHVWQTDKSDLIDTCTKCGEERA